MQNLIKKKNNNYVVYIHCFPNGKVYVGQTKQMPERRWANGRGYSTEIMKRAIKKYGWENINHIIVAEDLSLEEANSLEIKLIAEYKSNQEEHGYNMSLGGDNSRRNLHNSDEHNRKIAESHMKRVCCFTRSGEKVGTFESIMSAADFIGGNFRVISSCCNGTKKSGYGYIWRFEGCPFDQYETKNKKGGVKGFPVMVETIEGEFIGTFKTVKAAAQEFGVREDAIANVCRGRRDHINGLVFSYCEITKVNGGDQNGEL